jgi:hydroxymethylpyrimidine pyrophosphatase-like HAD family hydrolase
MFPTFVDTFGGRLYLTRSHPRLIEGMALGVDKGTGLQALCARLQIDPQRVLAIGDNDNDIPMLKAAGYAVAMGNATSGLKAVADWVAPSIEEDGAAIVLEQLVAGIQRRK